MRTVAAFFVGVLFSVGLGVSGMTQPEKIMGFLDFFGGWDASLAFVMAGATMVYFVFHRIIRGSAPVLTPEFMLPTRKDIDVRLMVGSALFGVGWGLAGFCPGPAITSLGNGAREAFIFVAAMITGMYVFAVINRVLSRPALAAR